MSCGNKIIGRLGEEIAVNYLKSIGHKIIGRNYRSRYGEIDLISARRNQIMFSEVKTRTNMSYGYPFEAVTGSKLKKIKKTSGYFLLDSDFLKNGSYNFAFSIISIILSEEFTNAVLASENPDFINLSCLRKGLDYNLEHLTEE